MLFRIILLLILSSTCIAKEIIIVQKEKKFFHNNIYVNSDVPITAKVNDTLRIKNLDTVVHNTHSVSDTLIFDSGVQLPESDGGKDVVVNLEHPGTIEIACAIHPSMRINIQVGKK